MPDPTHVPQSLTVVFSLGVCTDGEARLYKGQINPRTKRHRRQYKYFTYIYVRSEEPGKSKIHLVGRRDWCSFHVVAYM